MITAFDCLPVFFAVFWKSGVALGAALCVSLLLRKRSADVRRLVLSAAVVTMLVAAAALPMLPRWTAAIPLWFQVQRSAGKAVSEQASGPAVIDDAVVTAPDIQLPAAQPVARRIDLRAWLIPLLWFAGAAALLMRFAINLLGLRRLRKESEAVTDADLPRHVRLRRNGAIGAPVTWGIVRPIILVPARFEELPAECRDAVLCHELAHIQAHDFLMRSLAEIARALIWFQPLMWIAWRQLREEQELACDNRVLATGRKPSAYAKLLLDWDATSGLDSWIAVGMANRSCLKRRLYALLDPDLRRGKVASAGVAGTWFLALATALPLAALSFTQAAPARVVQSTLPARVLTAPELPVRLARAAQVAQSTQVQPPSQSQVRSSVPAATAEPKFDVASVKPCASGDITVRPGGRGGAGRINWSPGRLKAECQTLDQLIREAYLRYPDGKLWPAPMDGLRDPLISDRLLNEPIKGGAAWVGSDRYTIEAEAEGTPEEAVTRGPMLQALLEDRFKLRMHSETREIPVYELTVANGGHKLKPAQEGSCIPWGRRASTPRPAPEERTAANMPCGLFIRSVRNEGLDVNGTTIAHLCRNFSAVLDRDVIDKTGIDGLFDIFLDIPPEPRPADDPAGIGLSTPPTRPDPERTFSAAKAALQKLGLRLLPAKGTGKFLVIDRVERPSEN
jgi:uncharacterized protein (TIGR03435 family)